MIKTSLYYIIAFNQFFDGVDRNMLKESLFMKKLLRNIFLVVIGIAIFTLIINILIGFLNISGVSMKKISPKVYLNVEHTICFWK